MLSSFPLLHAPNSKLSVMLLSSFPVLYLLSSIICTGRNSGHCLGTFRARNISVYPLPLIIKKYFVSISPVILVSK
jgi:hypothetical protein